MTPINSTFLRKAAPYWREAVFFFSTILVSFVVMLPRLASPQFGLLDDGVIIRGARGVIENWHIIFHLGGQTGRFVPAYWLLYSLLYLIGGANPFLWFIANYVVILGITASLIYYVRFRGGSRLQGWAAGLFFILSGPIVENAYTLSKPEPIQLMWITISLSLITFYNRVGRRWGRAFLILGTCTALFLSNATKETSLAMIPISLGWFLAACRWSSATNEKMHFEVKRWFLLASLVAGSAFWGLRSYFVPVSFSEGAYTSFYRLEWQRVLVSVSRWVAWLIRDFPYLVPLIIFIGVSHVLRKQSQGRLLLDTAIWILGWIAIFLPWHSLLEYYLLPVAFGCAVFGGIGFGQALSSLKLAKEKSVRLMAGLCLGLSLWIWPFTLINTMTNARLQLTVDAANSEMIDFLTTVPANSLVLVNIPEPNEYTFELGVHLSELKQRPDILVDYFKFQIASPDEKDLSYYVATPQMKNQTLPSVRIAVHGAGAEQWNQSLQGFFGDKAEMVYQVERHVQLLDFGFHRFVCIFTNLDVGIYCKVPRPFMNDRVFSYGWQIYRVSSSIYSVALPAVFLPDGIWEFQLPDGSTRRLHFGQPGDVPLAGDWDGDGLSEIGVFSPANLTWYLDYDMVEEPDVEFRFTGMKSNDIPFTGDWDGNGTSTPGYFRPDDVSWHLRNSNTSGGEDWPVIQFGVPTDIPIIGDWDGDGRDTIGIYRPDNGEVDLKNDLAPRPAQVVFSAPTKSIPVVVDWGGHGFDSIAFVVDGRWFRRFVNCNCWPSNPAVPLEFGSPWSMPLAGRWEIKE